MARPPDDLARRKAQRPNAAPLSNLDAKLRERMRHEIRALQRELGITSVYVTHDQAEAMTISDRIIVMDRGRIEQEGNARSLYTHPASAFVASFLGVTNLIAATLEADQSDSASVRARVVSGDGASALLWAQRMPAALPNGPIYLSIRPEDVLLQSSHLSQGTNVLLGRVQSVNYLGNLVEYVVQAAGHDWRVQTDPRQTFGPGDEVSLVLPPDRCQCLPMSAAATVERGVGSAAI